MFDFASLTLATKVSEWGAFLILLTVAFHFGKKAVQHLEEKRHRDFAVAAAICIVVEAVGVVLLLTHKMI